MEDQMEWKKWGFDEKSAEAKGEKDEQHTSVHTQICWLHIQMFIDTKHKYELEKSQRRYTTCNLTSFNSPLSLRKRYFWCIARFARPSEVRMRLGNRAQSFKLQLVTHSNETYFKSNTTSDTQNTPAAYRALVQQEKCGSDIEKEAEDKDKKSEQQIRLHTQIRCMKQKN